jgi:hypothetical protein
MKNACRTIKSMFNDTQRQLNRGKIKEKILQPPTGMLK